jgi:1-acyl-sn-glycerol-3-phosphate acyltransferase
LFARWFARRATRLIRRRFDQVQVHGWESFLAATSSGPVVAVANHSSWWDTLVIISTTIDSARARGYALMREDQLRRFPFFGLVGAIGIDPRTLGSLRSVLPRCTALLDGPRRVLWVFPAGRESSSRGDQPAFGAAASLAARQVAGAVVVPVGIRYEVAGDPRPSLWVEFGDPLPATCSPADQRAAVAALLVRIDERVRAWCDTRSRHGYADVTLGARVLNLVAQLRMLRPQARRPVLPPSSHQRGV